MLNKGTTFVKPYASLDSRHLNFLAANKKTKEKGLTRKVDIKKNCYECSKINYHAEIFNLSWIKVCPIHNVKLSKECKCGKPWSFASSNIKNDCSICSPYLSFKELTKRNSLENDEYIKKLKPYYDLVSLTKKFRFYNFCNITPYIYAYGDDYMRNMFHRDSHMYDVLYIGQCVRFQISILQYQLKLTKKQEENYLKQGNQFDKIQSFSFSFNPVILGEPWDMSNVEFPSFLASKDISDFNDKSLDKMKKSIFEIREKLKEKFQLNTKKNHTVGKCHSSDKFCAICSAWYSWKRFISKKYNLNWRCASGFWKYSYEDIKDYAYHLETPPIVNMLKVSSFNYLYIGDEFLVKFHEIIYEMFLYKIYLMTTRIEHVRNMDLSLNPNSYGRILHKYFERILNAEDPIQIEMHNNNEATIYWKFDLFKDDNISNVLANT